MTIGADVHKELVWTSDPDGSARAFENSKPGVDKLLRGLEPGSTVAMEATGKYYKLLADTAFQRGFRVMVFNPRDVLYYAKSVSPRAKTDRVDAKVIARYALVRTDHHPYQPTPGIIATLKSMLRTRASLVASRTGLGNRLRECPESESYLRPSIQGLSASVAAIDKEILPIVRTLPQYAALRKIPGFGPVVAPYMLALLASATFRHSDSFVAFIGLDIRVKQSGKKKGKCCISKRGDPEARRLLYLAAQAVCRRPGPFRDMYLRYQLHGLCKIAALNAVARKLARTAWAMYTKNEEYRPDLLCKQPYSSSAAARQAIRAALRSQPAQSDAGVVATRPRSPADNAAEHQGMYLCHLH